MDCFSKNYQRTTVVGTAVWGQTPTTTTATDMTEVAPDIEVISAWPSANLYYQESLTLTCHGGGDPTPAYTWTRDSGSLPARAVVGGSEGTLTLVDVTDADSGVYTCTADNGFGTTTLNITVVGCPDVSTCPDSNSNCAGWAARGECDNNPGYMIPNCPLSCGVCFPNFATHCTTSTNRRGRSWDTWECYDVMSVPDAVRSELHLDIFYQKYLHAYGIPILGSSILPDDALRRACYDVLFMLADRKDIRDSYYNYYGRAAIMADTEVTLDIPEHSGLGPSFNTRSRGLGATVSRPVSTGAEENVLCHNTDTYKVEDMFFFAFAQGLDILGARKVVSGFKTCLQEAYVSALANGLWANTYADDTRDAYWAEGVQSFFNVNHESDPSDGIHNHVNTRAELRTYDPDLYRIIEEIFPCGNFPVKRCKRDYANYTLKMDCFSKNYQRTTVVGAAVWGQTTTATAATQVVGSLPIARYRLRYQRTDGSSSYQDLSPAPGAGDTSATVPRLLAETEYNLTLTSFGEDDQPNGVIGGTYTTDSVVVNVMCDQDSMSISIPLVSLLAVDVANLHLLDPNCVATVDEVKHVVTLETNLQQCGTRQEPSGDDKFIFSNEAIANQVTHENGAVRNQPMTLPFQCEFLRQYVVSQGGDIMYNIPSPRVQIVDANNSFIMEMRMYTSTDFTASYESSDFPIQVTPSDSLHFGLSVTSRLDTLELFAQNCVLTSTTSPNDSPQVKIIDDGCHVDQTLQKDKVLYNDKVLYYSVDAFTFPNVLDPNLVYFHCTMIICFKDDPDSRCKKGCVPAARRRRAVSDETEGRVRRGKGHEAKITQGPFNMPKTEEKGAGPVGIQISAAIGAPVAFAGVMVLLIAAFVLVERRDGLASGRKKGDDDTVGLNNYAFHAWGKTCKAGTADSKA
ncbi:OIT3 [Branchiostoma lanceolatum]|uniref:OIT3 protein n=1 Tax=Branchiostoma lanceolatum TaxID=7740 RepID=A0A8K0A1U0_BRALA|nr:OIT3 [Branchiostoma lanceolatum]